MARRRRPGRSPALLVLLLLCAAVALFLYLNRTQTTPPAPADRAGPASIYPDPKRTPGAVNPDIAQENIADNICNPDWSTRGIRPPSSYTSRLKKRQMEELGLPGSSRDYEEDHLISLELGGNPNDPRNLWPEPYDAHPGAREKDVVENYLHKQVCSGAMTLAAAQQAISHDWYKVYLDIHR
ncbi:MAG: hypothetical protein JST11_13225 [Acidobacteria bacterium]|nr:hypothetical protein [Acidobacteriota bacterium]